MSELVLRNRQSARQINIRLLSKAVRSLLDELAGAAGYKLCVHLVTASEMTRVNEKFLGHAGTTDVITFDHAERESPDAPAALKRGESGKLEAGLHGELFVCVDEAIVQARRFHTTWQSELVRYIIHGVLHLLGYDDTHPVVRVKMKREEARLLRGLSQQFTFSRLTGRVRRL